jgi:hypothetical protein
MVSSPPTAFSFFVFGLASGSGRAGLWLADLGGGTFGNVVSFLRGSAGYRERARSADSDSSAATANLTEDNFQRLAAVSDDQPFSCFSFQTQHG